MCSKCDQFEPAVVDEALRGNWRLRLSAQITRAKLIGFLRRVPIEDENASQYQCTSCSRLFRLTGEYHKPTAWRIEDSP